jgi:hypothetical protein
MSNMDEAIAWLFIFCCFMLVLLVSGIVADLFFGKED